MWHGAVLLSASWEHPLPGPNNGAIQEYHTQTPLAGRHLIYRHCTAPRSDALLANFMVGTDQSARPSMLKVGAWLAASQDAALRVSSWCADWAEGSEIVSNLSADTEQRISTGPNNNKLCCLLSHQNLIMRIPQKKRIWKISYKHLTYNKSREKRSGINRRV